MFGLVYRVGPVVAQYSALNSSQSFFINLVRLLEPPTVLYIFQSNSTFDWQTQEKMMNCAVRDALTHRSVCNEKFYYEDAQRTLFKQSAKVEWFLDFSFGFKKLKWDAYCDCSITGCLCCFNSWVCLWSADHESPWTRVLIGWCKSCLIQPWLWLLIIFKPFRGMKLLLLRHVPLN